MPLLLAHITCTIVHNHVSTVSVYVLCVRLALRRSEREREFAFRTPSEPVRAAGSAGRDSRFLAASSPRPKFATERTARLRGGRRSNGATGIGNRMVRYGPALSSLLFRPPLRSSLPNFRFFGDGVSPCPARLALVIPSISPKSLSLSSPPLFLFLLTFLRYIHAHTLLVFSFFFRLIPSHLCLSLLVNRYKVSDYRNFAFEANAHPCGSRYDFARSRFITAQRSHDFSV